MNKRDFNVVGNEGTDNQVLAKGIAFVKSRRAEINVVQMVESIADSELGDYLHALNPNRSLPRNKKGLKRLLNVDI